MKTVVLLTLAFGGLLTALVVAWPSLYVASIYLIVPGLILTVVPTGFLWCLAFAAFWFGLQARMREGRAALLAIPLAAATLVLVPVLANIPTQVAAAAARSGDRAPPGRIQLRGTVRMIRPSLRRDGLNESPCDYVCYALLHTPGIDAVQLADAEGKFLPTRFRLERDAEPCDRTVPGTRYWDEGSADMRLIDSWLYRADSPCVVAERGDRNADFEVRLDEHVARDPGPWALIQGDVTFRRLSISRGGTLLLRETLVRPQPLLVPLTLLPEGQMIMRFGWGRRRAGFRSTLPIRILAARTNAQFRAR